MTWIELENHLKQLEEQDPDCFWDCLKRLADRSGDYLLIDVTYSVLNQGEQNESI